MAHYTQVKERRREGEGERDGVQRGRERWCEHDEKWVKREREKERDGWF